MKPYLTVLKAGQAEQSIERSKFIGHILPAQTTAECESFFDGIRKKHRQATHNVPAYVLGEGFRLQWASDDGEPSGTAGAPILHLLVSEGISDVCLMVTRYFGGVKLGTGGLIRAYTGTAKLALAAAVLGRVSEKLILEIETDYPGYNRISAVSFLVIGETVFTDNVRISCVCEPDGRDKALYEIYAICPSAQLVSERTEIVTVPLAPGDR